MLRYRRLSSVQKNSTVFACLVCKEVGSTDYCDKCLKAKKDIKDDMSVDDMRKDYYMEVVYEKNTGDHSGYCSDPGEVKRQSVKVTKYFSIPSEIRGKGLLTVDKDCSSDHRVSFFYAKESYSQACGCAVVWTILSATVRNPITTI